MPERFESHDQDSGLAQLEDSAHAPIKRAPIARRPRLRGRVPGNDADAIIEREYEALKPAVMRSLRGKLASNKIKFAQLDLDGFYNQAWHSVYLKLSEGEQVDDLSALLVAIGYRRAVDEFRSLHPDRRADPDTLDTIGTRADVDALLDDRAHLQQFIGGMRTKLSERELQAAGLCYVYGYSRPEAAKAVGVRPQRMEKIMDSVSRKLGPLVSDIKRDEWCAANASLINAYAMGMLDDDTERYSVAVEHLKTCPACRRDVLRKRGIAAAIVPLPLLIGAGKAAAAAGAAGATGAAAVSQTSGGSTGLGLGALAAPVAGIAGAVAVVSAAVVMSHGSAKPDAGERLFPSRSESATLQASALAKAKEAAKPKPKPKPVRKAKRKKRAAKKPAAKQPVQQQVPVEEPVPEPAPQPAPAPQNNGGGGGGGGGGNGGGGGGGGGSEFDLR